MKPRFVTSVAIAMTALIALAAPAAAANYKPDGRIALAGGSPPVGNNVYNTNAAGQKVVIESGVPSDEGDAFTYELSFQNDGTRRDRLKVHAPGAPTTNGWYVDYFDFDGDATAAVRSGRYRTSRLDPGESSVLYATVTFVDADASPPAPYKVSRLVTIGSVANPDRKDAVRFIFKETP